ncbi:transposon Tf2-9 polyprotein [Trichonephila inaurata madagascariensis]|uniref:Transposon Tf2-9 polyprotein n=1 Tax=Trichonephila inaurata madagascariensis TaxID=2747483 RepID=A0A8X6YJF5_9ARAC|nr:transposon Tf2-9 polyprotein [Trichonephila inaurata madagascariensis]
MLADKLEAFDNIRRSLPSGPRKHVKASETVNDGRQISSRKPDRLPNPIQYQMRDPLSAAMGNPIPEALTTQVMVEIEGRSVLTKFIILPKAKGNRTLLGTDFLSSAGLVLNVKNTCWHFWDNPSHKYPFGEELNTPSIAEKMPTNAFQLREGESESLTSVQKEKLTLLLESFQNVFEPGGEATTILEHRTSPCNSDRVKPLIRKRGRPPKVPQTPGSSSGRRRNQRGRM